MERNVATAKMSMERSGLPSHAGQYFPAGLWGSQASVSSPTNFSSSSPALFRESHGHATPRTRFLPSPDYTDGDQLGGFNPNLAFPHRPAPRDPPPFNIDINVSYGGSPAYAASQVLRRGPLLIDPNHRASSSHADARSAFAGMPGDSFMQEMITSGSMAAASCPSYFTQEEARAAAGSSLDSQELDADQEKERLKRPERKTRPERKMGLERKPRTKRKNWRCPRPKGRGGRRESQRHRPSLASNGHSKKTSASPKPVSK